MGEQLRSNQENNVEVKGPSVEQVEKLQKNPETDVELSPRDIEARAEKARVKALETAISVEAVGKEKAEKHTSTTRRGPINKKQREKSYKRTMSHIQNELPVGSRMFSKVIHNKYIEKTSDVLAGTIMRPNAMLAGAFVAFVLTLLVYTVAKTIGYELSGFETIAAFIVGWIIGITYDYLLVLFTGKKF